MSTGATDFDRYRILVGVDGSEGSTSALQYAVAEADRGGTSLLLIHVIPDYVAMSPMLPLVPSELQQTGHAILDRAAAEAGSALGAGRVGSALLTGNRSRCLVRAGEHASLIVLGREAHSSLERLVTGATTIGVAARSTCPTIAVPPGWRPRAGKSRVVVGLERTAHSRALLRRAFHLATQRDAELVLIHTWELPSGYDDIIARRAGGQEWSDHVREQIEPHLAEWRAAYPRVQVELRVVHGQAARTLRDASEEADLLVLLRRPHGFPGGHLGGTARVLLRESACPTEVIPLGVGAGVVETDLDLERGGVLLK